MISARKEELTAMFVPCLWAAAAASVFGFGGLRSSTELHFMVVEFPDMTDKIS